MPMQNSLLFADFEDEGRVRDGIQGQQPNRGFRKQGEFHKNPGLARKEDDVPWS